MARVALVTGGSGGLGAAICQHLASCDYQVIFTYNSNTRAADQVLGDLPGTGHQSYKLDVNDSQQIDSLSQIIEQTYHGLDLLVNCAGTTSFVEHSDLDGLTDELIDRIFTVNVRAPFAMVRAMQSLLKTSKGCVVNITSIAAQTAMGSNIAYCASKAAMENMTRSLARALAPDVRVLAVAPGLVDTDFVKGIDPEWRNRQEKTTPLGRLAEAEEVARAVLLAAEQMTFSTGTTLAVDGGRPLGA